jgi:hypothetical protein
MHVDKQAVGMVLCLLLLPLLGFAWGRTAAERRLGLELEAKSRYASALSDSLRLSLMTVRADTVRVDSVVTRWRRLVERDTVTDTVRRVDTLTVEKVITVASATIDTVNAARRMCMATLSQCERAAAQADERARIALVLYDRDRTTAAKWRWVERGACVGATFGAFALGRK